MLGTAKYFAALEVYFVFFAIGAFLAVVPADAVFDRALAPDFVDLGRTFP